MRTLNPTMSILIISLLVVVEFTALGRASGPLTNPCTLVTQSDVESVINVKSRAGNRISRICMYSSSGPSMKIKEAASYTKVILRPISTLYFATLPRMGAKSVAGVGDEAYSYHDTIFVRKGSAIVNILVLAKPTRKDIDQVELALAKIAAGHM